MGERDIYTIYVQGFMTVMYNRTDAGTCLNIQNAQQRRTADSIERVLEESHDGDF